MKVLGTMREASLGIRKRCDRRPQGMDFMRHYGNMNIKILWRTR